MKIKRLCEYFLHLLWPVNCPVCGRPGVKICDECLNSIFSEDVFTFKLHDFTIKSISIYNDELHEALSALNDEELQRVYRASGFKLAEIFSRPDDIDLIITVPSNFKGSRGLNAAHEIAVGLGQSWGIKIFDGAKLTETNCKGLRVLIVNDVCITGSRLVKFADTLEIVGAEVVSAYVCASVRVSEENYAFTSDKLVEEKYVPPEIKLVKKVHGQVLLPPYFELVPIINTFGSLEVRSAMIDPDEAEGINKFEAGLQMAEFFEETEADYLIVASPQAQELAQGMSEHWQKRIVDLTQKISGLKVALVDYVCFDGDKLLELASECERSGAIVVCAYALVCLGLKLGTHKIGSLSVNILEGLSVLNFDAGKIAAEKFGEPEADGLILINSKLHELAEGMREIWGLEIFTSDKVSSSKMLTSKGIETVTDDKISRLETDKNLEPETLTSKKISGLRIAIVGDDVSKILELASECESAGAFVTCAYLFAETGTIKELDEQETAKLFSSEPIRRNIGGLEVYSAGLYGEEMRALVWDFKFYGKRELCEPTGRAMAKFLVKPEVDVIIPVPLHINSERNYNQTYEISRGMSDIWGVKIIEAAEWSREIPKQVGLTAQERRKINPDDFKITQDISGLRVILIDDICTTGSTLRALASACELAGAKIICAYTLASAS
ncbi:MAG: hypothetical protein IJU48_00295 [Synergistaceae bacterium]|nr:hypothetical protein [Synergistaceae bacterium]